MQGTRITRINEAQLSRKLLQLVSQAEFIAIDTEFTGLGDRKSSLEKDLRLRYAALRDTATRYALLGLGVCIFIANTDEKHCKTYTSHAFDLPLTPLHPHSVSPSSLAFLVDNGFDLNAAVREGLPFDPTPDDSSTSKILIRDLFAAIVSRATVAPLVVHNGLLDLMFLYHSFYAPLPATLDVFVADLADMFPAGLVDTKYIADYRRNMKSPLFSISMAAPIPASLELSKEICLPNGALSASRSLAILSKPAPSATAIRNAKRRKSSAASKNTHCIQYASHGYCPNGSVCPKSHNLDVILNAEEEEAARQQARKSGNTISGASSKKSKNYDADQESNLAVQNSIQLSENGKKDNCLSKIVFAKESASSITTIQSPANESSTVSLIPSLDSFETYHSACFDSYMTGFVFCSQQMQHLSSLSVINGTDKPINGVSVDLVQFVKQHGNKLYLMGKDVPLNILASAFTRNSDGHLKNKRVAALRVKESD
ncbi:Target of EGR1, member 1 (Nuclear) [Physocladia obscura]|uniref:Target of EGR1, member 1 (Nuclear) n=1 Tax=Physocladia obscura TaxID=109957 RepID=A0AAD5T073_9FUNG|nr:Target of EGR1, member 1 (Nuclear) [Physocladia obscura]